MLSLRERNLKKNTVIFRSLLANVGVDDDCHCSAAFFYKRLGLGISTTRQQLIGRLAQNPFELKNNQAYQFLNMHMQSAKTLVPKSNKDSSPTHCVELPVISPWRVENLLTSSSIKLLRLEECKLELAEALEPYHGRSRPPALSPQVHALKRLGRALQGLGVHHRPCLRG